MLSLTILIDYYKVDCNQLREFLFKVDIKMENNNHLLP